MKFSNPFNVKKVTGYQAVAGAATFGIPQRFVSGGVNQMNSVIQRIQELLRNYWAPTTSPFGKLAVLGDLFFTTDYALKKCSRGDRDFVNGEQDLMVLYKTIVDELCKAFRCSVNVLPQKLEDYWGRVLTKHGADIDTRGVEKGAQPTVAAYLTRAEVDKFRIRFHGGTAYMRDRRYWEFHSPNPHWVPANSAGIGWAYGPGAPVGIAPMMFPGYAGFALSMGREFYMAPHQGCFDRNNFFHSSYLAGDSVLCTGTIQIENGFVKGVANDSGHYQPSLDHLLNVAQTLKMQGCFMPSIVFHAIEASVPSSARTNPPGVVYTYNGDRWLAVAGDVLLQLRSGGTGLYDRHESNLANIRRRLPAGAVAP